MARVRSKRLVIDACVAQAAGPQHSMHPRGKSCRDFLLAVLKVCHRADFSAALKTEWKQHHSKFALEWQTSMFARKKIEHLDMEEDPQLRERICNAAENDGQEAALIKDCHLIEAALETDKIIVSLDETAREAFRKASQSIADLRNICWVNPVPPEEKAIEWL
jgi:hypothetical protein